MSKMHARTAGKLLAIAVSPMIGARQREKGR